MSLAYDAEKPSLDELAHFGVKGMKWGVRKERDSASREPRLSPEQKAMAKKVAIGAGALLVVAGAAVVAYQLNKNGKLPLRSVSNTVAKGQEAVGKVLSEPVDVIHATRGESKGFTFLRRGGVPTFLEEYEAAFGDRPDPGVFKRFGVNGEKIAASFIDPDGKKDFAGRLIPHEIIVPKTMTDGINDLDDVKSKIWPLVKDQYEVFYESSKVRHSQDPD